MNLPKILILIPVWKRPEITEICFSGLDRIRKHRANIEILAVISENEYKARCDTHEIEYTFFENQPLGAKKNHGLKVALDKDWDYLIELNSDDLIKNELLDIYDTLNHDYLALRNFCFLDSKTLRLKEVESKTAYGIGRRYSRRAVESCKVKTMHMKETCITSEGVLERGKVYDVKQENIYGNVISEGIKMWNDAASAGMDNFSNLLLNSRGYFAKQIFCKEPLAVDIKSDVNIWAFNENAGIDYDLDKFKNGLPELDGIINSYKTTVLSC